MLQKFTGHDVKKCVSFLIKVRELRNLKIKVSLLVLFMLFFSAENHCRQKNTLVSTKTNPIVVKNSLVYSYKVTHLSVLILLSGSTKFSLSQTFATVEESETLKKRREEETRCDSIATGPVFPGTGSPPPTAAIYTFTLPAQLG